MDRYILLMTIVLGIYALIFTFFTHNKAMSWYISGGAISLGLVYLLVRRKFSINTLVHLYLITAPIYSFYVILAFWNNSVMNFCWLLPIPLGASVFFSRKIVLRYTLYSLFHIVVVYIIANNFSSNFPKHTQQQILFSDTILITSNILVVALLLYYKDKIGKQEVLFQLKQISADKPEVKNKKTPEILSESAEIDHESMEKLFARIETCMIENKLFKDIKFNLSALSVALDVNSSYISKAIRYKGYPNFNTYLNIYRIGYVKKLFNEIDFQKTTLMYVYTEAGFSNQSTFNRVFKQIEGITPSEYIQQNLKPDDTDGE
ncbi:AraC family transcriptional regulator [Chryseobacterium sp. NRRL B-14859]|uniref:helix-turn-helix domain-containing protein n=1 Tax=Chryseobacterium sp. NRRL B-14859 TaxID=1562763 RepID=UPI003392847A